MIQADFMKEEAKIRTQKKGNSGTLILDATCTPQNIEYPQDLNLLNKGREDLEGIINEISYAYNLKKPRMYRQNVRADYLALAKCRKRNGNYPERILAEKIYRNRKNLAFCKLHGIRLSVPALGRPKKDPYVDKKTEYIDAVDRIEVERAFSLAKRSFGLGLITTRLENTTRSSIVLSIIAMNVDHLTRFSFMRFFIVFSRFECWTQFRVNFLTTNC